MTRLQMLEKIADATARWNAANADHIPNRYPDGVNPHEGETDIAEHHALISATPGEIRSLEQEHQRILRAYQSDANPDRGR